MSPNIENKPEYRELNLTKVDDLSLFLENVDDVYIEADQYKELAESDEYKSLEEEDISGNEVFTTLIQKKDELQDLIKVSRDQIVANGNEIEDDNIELMQTLYNDIILLRNHIRDAYENFTVTAPIEEEAAPEEPVRLFVAGTREDETEVQSESNEEEQYPVEEKNIQETKDPFASVECVLQEVEDKILGTLEQAHTFVSSSEITDDQNDCLDDLDKCVQRVEDLKKRVESSKEVKEDEVVLASNLKRYARVAADIERKANNILRNLKQEQEQEQEQELEQEKEQEQQKEKTEPVVVKEEENVSDLVGETVPEFEPEDNEVKLTPEVKRKTMYFTPDADSEAVDKVPISFKLQVAKDAEKRLKKEPGESVSNSKDDTQGKVSFLHKIGSMVVSENEVSDDVSVTADLESRDVINEAVPNKKVNKITHPKLVHQERSLTREYLGVEPYASFIRDNYTSAKACERMLDSIVTQIENETVGALERWLKEEFTSPFEFMQNMSVGEVEELGARPDIKEFLSSKNIKYETFIKWIDLIGDMQDIVGNDPSIKFGELFARWIIEDQMLYIEEMAEVSEEKQAA